MSFITLVALVLLGGSASAEHSTLPDCEPGIRHIDLSADLPGKAHEICVRPGRATTVLSDSKLAWVTVEDGHRVSLHWGEAGLTIVPSAELYDGERLPMRVRFKDGAAPESVNFILVVHPSRAERQVEVTRKPRPLATYQQEAAQARAETLRCREEQERLRSECGGPGGLRGLLAIGMGRRQGMPIRKVVWADPVPSRNALTPTWVASYRFDRALPREGVPLVQVAVELELKNNAPHSWVAAGAALMRGGEEVKRLDLLQPAPIVAGERGALVGETTLTEREAQGSFTLRLWDAEGCHSVTLDGA